MTDGPNPSDTRTDPPAEDPWSRPGWAPDTSKGLSPELAYALGQWAAHADRSAAAQRLGDQPRPPDVERQDVPVEPVRRKGPRRSGPGLSL